MPADQAPLAKRNDILVYQTEPLTTAMEVTGYPEVILHAASTAPDTDFFARLIDVAPDGTNRDIASGMVRARYRDGLDKPKLHHARRGRRVSHQAASHLERVPARPPHPARHHQQ